MTLRFLKLFIFLTLVFLILWVLFFYRSDSLRVVDNTRICLGNIFNGSQIESEVERLTIENEKLISELNAFRRTQLGTKSPFEFKVAHVYSRYPFNNRALIILDIGSNSGIRQGMPVLAKDGILLGKIKEIKQTQSEVETIFSPGWKNSVGIGDKKVKAVLSGGATPSVDFIAKEAELKEGDRVFNLSPELPLNLYIGTLSNISGVSYDVWQRGEVNTAYRIEDLDQALIIVNFP